MAQPTYADFYEDWRRRLPSFSEPTAQSRLFGAPGQATLMASVASLFFGFSMGSVHGGKTAGLRFRAEHTHKLPKSTKGWYFYHKRKNYYVMKHGIQEGIKLGSRLTFWTTAYFTAEASVDYLRGGRRDFVSSTTAALGMAGVFSLINRFSRPEAARMAKMGLIAGLGYGLLQDGLAMAVKGRRFNYVDAFFGQRQDDHGSLPA